MKPYIILILTLGVIACSNNPHKIATTDSVQYRQSSNVNPLTDKGLIYHIADSIVTSIENKISKNEYKEYFSLRNIDTTDALIVEDYFTNNKTKTTLVLLDAEGNPPDGTDHYLLLLLSYTDTYNLISVEQSGDFTPSDIRDLNGDGVKEIIICDSSAQEGISSDSYSIVNFRNGKMQVLFSRLSESKIYYDNNGLATDYHANDYDLAERYHVGDTLEHKFECSLINNKTGTYNIRQIETSKIHNGGANDSEIVMNLIIKSDTTEIKLK